MGCHTGGGGRKAEARTLKFAAIREEQEYVIGCDVFELPEERDVREKAAVLAALHASAETLAAKTGDKKPSANLHAEQHSSARPHPLHQSDPPLARQRQRARAVPPRSRPAVATQPSPRPTSRGPHSQRSGHRHRGAAALTAGTAASATSAASAASAASTASAASAAT